MDVNLRTADEILECLVGQPPAPIAAEAGAGQKDEGHRSGLTSTWLVSSWNPEAFFHLRRFCPRLAWHDHDQFTKDVDKSLPDRAVI